MSNICKKDPLNPICIKENRYKTTKSIDSFVPKIPIDKQMKLLKVINKTKAGKPAVSPKAPVNNRISNNLLESFNFLKSNLNSKIGNELKVESPEMHKYARLSDASFKYGYSEYKDVRNLLKEGKLTKDFRIITGLSTKNWITLKSSTTGEVVMSFRGSDSKVFDIPTLIKDPTRITNIKDWVVNVHSVMGQPEKSVRYSDAVAAVKKTSRILNIDPKNIVFTGTSLGGGLARRMAEIFNSKAITFNAVDHPLIDMTLPGAGPKGNVTAYRTYGDVVSVGHEFGTPNHMNVIRITAKPGTETNVISQHGIEQFYNSNDSFETVRTSKLRNFLGTTAGVLGKTGFGIGAAELFQPIYTDPKIEAKEQAFLFADTAKFLAFDGLLDPGGVLVDLIDTMGIGLQPGEIIAVRKVLGIKELEPEQYTPPPFITELQKLSGRYAQDQLANELYFGTPVSAEATAAADARIASNKIQSRNDVPIAGGFTRNGRTYYEQPR